MEEPVEEPVEAPAFGANEPTNRHTYNPRGQPMKDVQREKMIEQWGSWTLVDNKKRPTTDYYKQYPNRDIPRSEFPKDAWQIDKQYLTKFLPEALALVRRAQEAILAEYGQAAGRRNKKTFEERSAMFNMTIHENIEEFKPPKSVEDNGGWTSAWMSPIVGDRRARLASRTVSTAVSTP